MSTTILMYLRLLTRIFSYLWVSISETLTDTISKGSSTSRASTS
jgi:hypothetical protein